MGWLRRLARLPSLAHLCLGPLLAALALAGCASLPAPQAAQVGGPPVLEADGLPAQVHPVADIRQLPDDPTEPFSANYGALARLSSGPGQARRLAEDAIIAAAITAHEVRKP
jgi:hypothetical protein